MEENANYISCPKCGTENTTSNNYCLRCASPLKEGLPPPPITPPTAASKKQKVKKGCLISALSVGGFFAVLFVVFFIWLLSTAETVPEGEGTTKAAAVQSSTKAVTEKKPTTTKATTEKATAAPTESTTSAPEPYAVTVDTLIAALNENALRAAEVFENSYVKVTGRVDVIDSSGKYFTIYPVETNTPL